MTMERKDAITVRGRRTELRGVSSWALLSSLGKMFYCPPQTQTSFRLGWSIRDRGLVPQSTGSGQHTFSLLASSRRKVVGGA